VKYLTSQVGGSDTSLNGLWINCKNPKTNEEQMLVVHPGYWGDEMSKYTSPNKYVCGARVRWEGM
jgi:hypothetical protein